MYRSREVRSCPESFKRPNPKENRNETQDQNQGRKARLQPQHDRSLTVVCGMYEVRHTQSTRKLTKGESYEAQDQNQSGTSEPEPQHDHSLTLLGHVPIPRSEVNPESFKRSNPKENRNETQDQNQGWKARWQP